MSLLKISIYSLQLISNVIPLSLRSLTYGGSLSRGKKSNDLFVNKGESFIFGFRRANDFFVKL